MAGTAETPQPPTPYDWRVMSGIPDTRSYSGTQLDKVIMAYVQRAGKSEHTLECLESETCDHNSGAETPTETITTLYIKSVPEFLQDMQRAYDDLDCSWKDEVYDVLDKYKVL